MTSVLFTGYDGHGQAGNAPNGKPIPRGPLAFTGMPGLGSPDHVVAGYDVVFAITAGITTSIGGSGLGQACKGTFAPFNYRLGPTSLEPPVTALALGEAHGVAIANRRLATWGGDLWPTLGNGVDNEGHENPGWIIPSPVYPVLPNGFGQPVAVAAGEKLCGALDEHGQAITWGYGRAGGIGDGSLHDKAIPTLVSQSVAFVELAIGGQHVLARTEDGDVYVWGSDHFGQLGLGDFTNRVVPTLLPRVEAVSLEARESRSYAITIDDRLLEWGNGNPNPSAAPGPVSHVSVRQIASGSFHDHLIDTEDELWGKGQNPYGEVGDGTRINKPHWTPLGARAREVSGGFQFSVALS